MGALGADQELYEIPKEWGYCQGLKTLRVRTIAQGQPSLQVEFRFGREHDTISMELVGEVKTPTPHKPHVSSCTSSLSHSNVVQVTTLAFCLQPSVVQVSAMCLAHRHDWMLLVQCHTPRVLRRQYSESRCVSIPLLYARHTLRGHRRYTFHRL